jgi:hypothetical protein
VRTLYVTLAALTALIIATASLGAGETPSQIVLDGQAHQTDMELRSGDVRAHLFYERGKTEDQFPRSPTLHVFVGQKRVQVIEDGGNGFEWPPALVQILEMDPSNPYPEVVFSTYTGGAHCCNTRRIVTSSPDGRSWSVVEPDAVDGGTSGAEDTDYDGVYEIVHPDNRFYYAFASYAGSTAPLQIFALKGRQLIDISFEERFREVHRDTLRDLQPVIDDIAGQHERNGFLAGYVALKYLVGEGPQGWKFMLQNFDRNSDWELSTCTGGYDANGDCRKMTNYPDFPSALHAFLSEAGYIR